MYLSHLMIIHHFTLHSQRSLVRERERERERERRGERERERGRDGGRERDRKREGGESVCECVSVCLPIYSTGRTPLLFRVHVTDTTRVNCVFDNCLKFLI